MEALHFSYGCQIKRPTESEWYKAQTISNFLGATSDPFGFTCVRSLGTFSTSLLCPEKLLECSPYPIALVSWQCYSLPLALAVLLMLRHEAPREFFRGLM